MPKTTGQTATLATHEDADRKTGRAGSQTSARGSDWAGVVGPEGILALQRVAGNKATSAWIESQRQRVPLGVQRRNAESPVPVVVQRRLLGQTDDALKAAKATNPGEFGTLPEQVDAYVTDDEQKKINDVESAGMRISGFLSKLARSISKKSESENEERSGLLTKFVRAVIYREYVERVEPLAKDTTLDATEKAKKRKGYLARTLLNRDKQAALLKKGIGSSETQAFLDHWGLLSDKAKATKEEDKTELKNAPRIDVRSTFIGGPILGINLRAHLYIVYTLADGRMMYIRGGPGTDVSRDRPQGSTTVDVGYYSPDTVDWDPSAPSKTIATGAAADNKLDAFLQAAAAVNSMKVDYNAFMRHKMSLSGENCNAAAWTVLDRVGLPKAKPTGIHPGWGHQIGAHSGKGNKMPERETVTPTDELSLEADVTVYRDRAGVETLAKLPAGTTVGVVGEVAGNSVKITFDSDGKTQVGYVALADLRKAPASELPGDDKKAQKTTAEIVLYNFKGERQMAIRAGSRIAEYEGQPDAIWVSDAPPNKDGLVEVFYNGYDYAKADDLRKAGIHVGESEAAKNEGEKDKKQESEGLTTADVNLYDEQGDEKQAGCAPKGARWKMGAGGDGVIGVLEVHGDWVEVFCYQFEWAKAEDLRKAGVRLPEAEKAKPNVDNKAHGDDKSDDKHAGADFSPNFEVAVDNTEIDLADRTVIYVPAGTKVQVDMQYVREHMSTYQPVFIEFMREGKKTPGKVIWGALKKIDVSV
jgi:hypothetical protein